MLRRCNTGFEDGSYSVVAGHVEAYEEITSAAVREAKKEVGIEIQRDDLHVVGVMHRKSDAECVSFFLTASTWTGDIVDTEPDLRDDLSLALPREPPLEHHSLPHSRPRELSGRHLL